MIKRILQATAVFAFMSALSAKAVIPTIGECKVDINAANSNTDGVYTHYAGINAVLGHIMDETSKIEVLSQDLNIVSESVSTSSTNADSNTDNYTIYDIPEYSGFKTFERYEKLTTGKQKNLQDEAYTDEYGFRLVDGRYLVALGTHFGMNVGDDFTLVLENGRELPCKVGDIKSNSHTDADNIFTITSDCCSEFIVDSGILPQSIRKSGNISDMPGLDAPVVGIIKLED